MDQDFYGDSSSALGLNHRAIADRVEDTVADAAEEERYLAVTEGLRALEHDMLRCMGITDVSVVIPSNAGAHQDFEDRKRALMDEGYTQVDAERIALSEQPDVMHPEEPVGEPKNDYLGASVTELMRANVKPSGGGSRNGKRREKPRKRNGNYRTIEDEPRNNPLSVRVSNKTLDAFEAIELETGVNIPGLLAAIANLHASDKGSAILAVKALIAAVPPVPPEIRRAS